MGSTDLERLLAALNRIGVALELLLEVQAYSSGAPVYDGYKDPEKTRLALAVNRANNCEEEPDDE